MNQIKRFKLRWVVIPAFIFLAIMIWAGDSVTLQGERTIYTVNCVNGTWVGNRCSGEVVAGPRFRYRALRARGEVLFWVLGMNEPSSKLTDCLIKDGRNWTCPESADAARSLTLAMSRGEPRRNPAWSTRPFHSVSKVSWMMLDRGFRFAPDIDQ